MNGSIRGMDCNELVELVTDYLEGRLEPGEIERFDAHLEECEGCATYLEQMRSTIAALGHLPPESLTPEAEQRLLATFRDWRSTR
jgi:anti-sigma factor RsiW